jgi:hypothetical protein
MKPRQRHALTVPDLAAVNARGSPSAGPASANVPRVRCLTFVSRVRVITQDELREPRTYASVGVVRISREELRSSGVTLTPLDDPGYLMEAGPVEEALVETDGGEQALLIWDLHIEENAEHFGNRAPLEVRAPRSTRDPRAFVYAVVEAFGVPRERVEWVVPSEHWPP